MDKASRRSMPSVRDALSGRVRDAMFDLSSDFPKVVEVNLVQIRPNPNQPRKTIDEEALAELASSIEQHGLLQPIVVKEANAGYVLVAGQRRFLAHQRLGRETIFAIITQGDADEIALIENLQREELNPLEEADAMARLMESHGYTQQRLGEVLGRKQNTISEILSLAALPQEIKEEYRTSDTKASKAVLIELARMKDPEAQRQLWAEVRHGGTVRQVRARKAERDVTSPMPSSRLVSSGRSFLRKLERVSPQEVVVNRDQYRELLALRVRIDELIDRYVAEHGVPDDAEA
jgi:ParB family transcriptional regulator, chromosome partitioning protein